MANLIYSDPRITHVAKGLMDDPPKVKEYMDAVNVTVEEVVSAILERVDGDVQNEVVRERE